MDNFSKLYLYSGRLFVLKGRTGENPAGKMHEKSMKMVGEGLASGGGEGVR